MADSIELAERIRLQHLHISKLVEFCLLTANGKRQKSQSDSWIFNRASLTGY